MPKKTTAKAPKYPTTIYVRWAGEDDGQYLEANDTAEPHAEVGQARTVAVYELKRVATVTANVEIK